MLDTFEASHSAKFTIFKWQGCFHVSDDRTILSVDISLHDVVAECTERCGECS
ncbi:hypothetical protein BCO18442_03763 [Burkholderia contaminans]|nr:hypothetical protein BCO18442_03763 [Burkholderia contaminans]